MNKAKQGTKIDDGFGNELTREQFIERLVKEAGWPQKAAEEEWEEIQKDEESGQDLGNAPPPHGCDDRKAKCLKCGAIFQLNTYHDCQRPV